MAFHEVKGDLFTAPAGYVIGHGVNMKGFMGSGIAKLFKERYLDMFIAYRDKCHGNNGYYRPDLGDVFMWQEPDGRRIANIFSQDQMGPNAEFQAIFNGVYDALLFTGHGNSLAIPRIGCGIGGQDWNKVKPMLEALANYWDDRDLYIYSI